jgi:PAS domain S-box-containing protein
MTLAAAYVMIGTYALVSLAATLINTAHAIFVLLKNPRSAVNRLWSLAIFSLVVWGCGEVIMRSTDDIEVAAMVNRVCGIGFRLLPAFFLHFTFAFTENPQSRNRSWMIALIYAPALVFSALQSQGYITKITHLPWGYTSTPGEGFLYYILWLESYFLWGLYLCYQKFVAGRFKRERKQSLFVLLGVIIPLLPSSIIDAVLPLLGIQFVRISVVSSTVTVAFVTYAIVQFQLMSLTPETSATTVLDVMGGLLAVTDPAGRIVFTNQSFKEMLGIGDERIDRLRFVDFLEDGKELLLGAYENASAGTRSILSEVKLHRRNGRTFPGLLSVSPIASDGETVGFVHYARDITELKRVDEAIRESEERYRTVVETVSDGIIMIDEESKILSINSAAEQIFGYPLREMLGEQLTKLMPDYLRHVHKSALKRYLGTGVKHLSWDGIELPGLHKTGKEIPLEISFGEFIKDGKHVFTGIVRDIAERKRVQDALHHSEKRFRSVWENASDGMRLTDENGTIVAVNAGFCALVEMKQEDLVGKPITATYEGNISPEEMLQKYRRRFEQREIETQIERILTLRSGKNLYLEVSNSFVELEHGKALLLGVFRDVTERREAEQQIQMLAHTITSMQESVSITDMENNIISVNPAFLKTYGYEASEIIGKNITILRAPNNPPGLTEKIFFRTLKGGWTGELLNRRKNGEEFPIIMSSSIVRDNAGTPVAFVGIARDITEEKNLQRQLEETARQRNEDLQRFAVSVQRVQEEERRRIARELHDDLGQQLSGMKFNIEVFEDSIPETDKQTRAKLEKFMWQIDSMITEIRRISANLHPAVLDDFGLVVALQLLCEEFQRVQLIRINFEPPEQTLARHDPHVEIALFRIVQEALSNIAKHAAASAATVRLGQTDGTVSLVIEDDGKGFNLDTVHARKDVDRGLGLISMRERSEDLGGKFRIETGSVRGTKIIVEFPVRQ